MAACRPDRPPVGPTPRNVSLADVSVRGHDTRVELVEGPPLRGELIAAGPEGLWLKLGASAIEASTAHPAIVPRRWREQEAEHRFVPTEQIRRVVVSRYRAGRAIAATGGWTGGLMLLTLSHGFFAVFTMPITAVVGGGAMLGTHLQSKAFVHRGSGSRRAALPERLTALRGFARFPQGAPPGWPGTSEAEAEAEPAEHEAEAVDAEPAEPAEAEPAEAEAEPADVAPSEAAPESSSPADEPPEPSADLSEPAEVPEPPRP